MGRSDEHLVRVRDLERKVNALRLWLREEHDLGSFRLAAAERVLADIDARVPWLPIVAEYAERRAAGQVAVAISEEAMGYPSNTLQDEQHDIKLEWTELSERLEAEHHAPGREQEWVREVRMYIRALGIVHDELVAAAKDPVPLEIVPAETA